MNKLFTKIASVSLGLALAAGVGVALGQKGAVKAKAADYVEKTCDFSLKTTSHANYNDKDGDGGLWAYNSNFSVYSGANNNGGWAFVKLGAKKATIAEGYSKPYVKSTVASTNAISKVKVKALKNTGSNTDKMTATWKLYAASDAAFSSVTDTVDLGTFNHLADPTTYTINPSSGTSWAAGSFFKIEFTVTNSSTTNGIVWLEKVELVYTVEVQTPDLVTVSGESGVAVGATTTLTAACTKGGSSTGVNQNVIWSSNNEKIAKVSADGVVTGVSNGSATITAKAEDDASVYGTKSITVSGGKSDNSYIALVPDGAPAGYGDNNYVVIGGVYTLAKQIMKQDGKIQVKQSVGELSNVAQLYADITSIEIRFNAGKTQGTGFKVQVSADGSSFTDLSGVEGYTGRYTYAVAGSGNRYFKLVGPSSGTLYLDEFLVGFGNAVEAKLVTLAAALNDILDSECTGSSDVSAISAAKWAEVKAAYDGGDSDAKAALAAVGSNLSYHEVNQFLERYDHIVAGYGYNNFLDRAAASSGVRVSGLTNENDTIMIIVVITAAVSALAFGALLLIKKKKHN